MAEFGINATQLSAPSGAGTNIVAPVTASILDNGVAGALGNIVDIFAKGIIDSRKSDAKQQENAVVSEYTRKQVALDQAVATGQIKPSEAASRGRALFGEYAAGYSQFIDAIENSAKALKGYGGMGQTDDLVKREQDLEQSRISAAQAAGFPITTGMAPNVVGAMVDAHQTSVRGDQEMSRFYKQQEYQRANGTYNQGISDRQGKELSLRLINEIADTNMGASHAYVQNLSEDMRAGKIAPEAAQLQWSQYTSRILAQIQSASGVNPELAGPYRSLFSDLQLVGTKLLDPKSETDKLDNEIKLIINKQKLVGLAQPGVAPAVALSQMVGQNAEIALASSKNLAQALAVMGQSEVGTNPSVPQLVGNKDIEKDGLNLVKSAMTKLGTKSYKDEPKAKQEILNTVNTTLSQIGDSLGKPGADPAYLRNVAAFVASAEFGKFASENKLDANSITAASRTFQVQYEKQIIKGVDQVLSSTFVGNKENPSGEGMRKFYTSSFDKNNLAITFTGSGIAFNMKTIPTDPFERKNAQAVLQELKGAQDGVNQLIHIGAHMEGTTNYSKYWESNKHIILPIMGYPAPAQPAAPVKNNNTEEAMRVNAQLTPTEQARSNAFEVSDTNVQELQKELSRKGLTPEAKRVLEEYLANIMKQRGGK